MSSREENQSRIARFHAAQAQFRTEWDQQKQKLTANLARVVDMTAKCTELVALQKEATRLAPKLLHKAEKLVELYAHPDHIITPGARLTPSQKQLRASIRKLKRSRELDRSDKIDERIEALIIMLDQSQCKVLRHELLVQLASNNPAKLAQYRANEFGTIAEMGGTICTNMRRNIAVSRSQFELTATPGKIKEVAEKHRASPSEATEQAYADAIAEITHLCVICLEESIFFHKPAVTPCNHIFHRACLLEWVDRANSCPTCRRMITRQDI
jgi:hypothetical protein